MGRNVGLALSLLIALLLSGCQTNRIDHEAERAVICGMLTCG